MNWKVFLKEWSLHLSALTIIILLCLIWFTYATHYDLQEQIVENCGWGEEDFYCFCEKSQAIKIKNKAELNGLQPLNLSLGDYYVGLD